MSDIPEAAKFAEKDAMFRFSCRKYQDKPIPEGVLERILGYSQPFRVIVTREPAEREKFRTCLVGANARATEKCQAYYILLDPTQSIKMFEDMMHRSTAPQVKQMFPPEVCLGKHDKLASPSCAWAEKSCGLVMGAFEMLCSAYGLATIAMEGFIADKLMSLLEVPEGFEPSIVFAVGYPTDDARMFETVRFKPEEVIFENKFGNGIKKGFDANPEIKK